MATNCVSVHGTYIALEPSLDGKEPTAFKAVVLSLGYRIAFQRFFESARTFAEAEDAYRQVLTPHLLAAGFMKNRDGYAGVEMEDVARYLLSQDRVDGVLISLNTVSRKMATLRAMPEVEFSQLKQVKNIDEILPRLVALEQTLITFGYREIRCLSASWEWASLLKRESIKVA